MAKAVYLSFEQRNKYIKFTPEAGKSDLQCLQDAVESACVKDFDLRRRMEGHYAVFQMGRKKMDTDEITFVDIEDDDEIKAEAEIRALFYARQDPPPITSDTPVVIATGPSEEMNVDNTLGFMQEDGGEAVIEILSVDTPKQVPSASISKPSVKNKRKKIKTVHLPDLTQQLKGLVGKADVATEKFIAHYGAHLRKETEDDISKAVYNDYAEAITTRHEELKDPSHSCPHAIVREMLSMYVRNARRREKLHKLKLTDPLENSSNQEAGTSSGKKGRKQQVAVVLPTPHTNENTETAAAAAQTLKLLEQLQKIGAGVGATPHVVCLAKETFERRREWITSIPPMSGPSYITEEYPHMLCADLILLELSLMKKKEICEMEADIAACVTEVAKFKDTEVSTDEHRALFLEAMYREYKPRNSPKDLPECIIVKEAGDPLETDLVSKKNEGARLVFYFDRSNPLDSCLPVAFIVADEVIRIKLEKPTVSKCVLTLLACYHAWDSTFPGAYKCFLNIFDVFGLASTTNDVNVSFKTFRRDFNKWKTAQSETV